MDALIIEDNQKSAHALARRLIDSGYTVDVAHDGASGLAAAERATHRVILLDLVLPVIDGWEVLETLRRTSTTPVMLLTGQSKIEDRVRGLEAGAYDYVVKPYALAEVLARIQSVLRRAEAHHERRLEFEDLAIDTVARSATRAGKRVLLTSKEFALLHFLMQNAGQPVNAAMIARSVWGIDFDTETNMVAVAMRRLRAKIDDDHAVKLIRTIPGVGYVMDHPETLGSP